MSLLDIQEVQDICGHTALCARKWSGFICKRASGDTTLSRLGLLKKEEERRRMPNRVFFTSRGAAYVNLRYIEMSVVIHSFDWKSAIENDGTV